MMLVLTISEEVFSMSKSSWSYKQLEKLCVLEEAGGDTSLAGLERYTPEQALQVLYARFCGIDLTHLNPDTHTATQMREKRTEILTQRSNNV